MKADIHISRVGLKILDLLTSIMIVWLFVVEVRFFHNELKRPFWIAGLLTAFLIYIPFHYWNFLIGNQKIKNLQVYLFSLYIFPVAIVVFALLFLKVLPSIRRSLIVALRKYLKR